VRFNQSLTFLTTAIFDSGIFLSKKKFHDEEIRRGIGYLGESGLKVDDLSPGFVPRLEEQWGKGRETVLAIVFFLGKIVDSAAATALLRMDGGAEDKDLKKEIRRSLFKLSQKGLTIPEAGRIAEKTPTSILSRSAEVEAYMSPVDGAGGRLVWIVKPQAGHGLQTIQGVGNHRARALPLGGSRVRRETAPTHAERRKK